MTIHVYICEESELQYKGQIQYHDPEGQAKISFELTLLRPSSDIEAMTAWSPYDSRQEIVRDSISLVFTSIEKGGRVRNGHA